MELKDAVEKIWLNRKYKSLDAKQVISHLNEEVAESMKALMQGNEEKARRELEDALSCLFIALKVLEVDPEEAVNRQSMQMQKASDSIIVIKEAEVEILVHGLKKGGWSIWGDEDIEQAQKIAKELGCQVVYER